MAKYKLAHLGYVVENIDRELKRFIKEGAEILSSPIDDTYQKVKICLIKIKGDVTIELISPLTADSPIISRLNKGGGLDHICFYTDDLEKTIEHEQDNGAILVCPPVTAIAFSTRIAFVHRRSGLITEFIETK